MGHRKTLLLTVTVACVAVGAAAWWLISSGRLGLWPTSRPNVILITIDTLRPDRLSCYGYKMHRTPNLDWLAQQGVLFEQAFCDVPWTTPSMASVMTGRYATVHGLQSSYQRLGPEATTLAELLSADGVQTAALIASFPLDSIFGLDQGFTLYDDDVRHGGLDGQVAPVRDQPTSREEIRQFLADEALNSAYRPDNEQSDRAIRWLRQEHREPFFLWLHYFGPHEKPQATDNIYAQVKLLAEQYDPDVVEVDTQVGRVLVTLDALGLSPRTAVIVHADHGQSITEHGYFGHGRYVYDPVQHVPLLMRWPGHLPAGVRVTRQVRNLDLFPTIAELMQVKAAVPIDGASLLPLVAGKDNSEPEETYVETYLSANRLFADKIGPYEETALGFRRFGVRTPQWKLIVNDPIPIIDDDDPAGVTPELRARYASQELYDLRADPGETKNVIAEHADVAAAYTGKLQAYQTRGGPASEKMKLDDASRERLRSLGYLSE